MSSSWRQVGVRFGIFIVAVNFKEIVGIGRMMVVIERVVVLKVFKVFKIFEVIGCCIDMRHSSGCRGDVGGCRMHWYW